MSTQRFTTGSSFIWRATTCVVQRMLPEQLVVIAAMDGTGVTIVPLATLVHALFDGALHFITTPAAPTAADPAPAAVPVRDLADYPATLVHIARARLDAIRPLLALPPAQRTRGAVCERVAALRAARSVDPTSTVLTTFSATTLYRWLADYLRSGPDLRSLIPATGKRGGKGHARLAPEVEAVVDTVLHQRYLVREAVTIDDVWHEILARVADENEHRPPNVPLVPPSRATVTQRIDRLDLRERLAAHAGRRVARHAFTQHRQRMAPTVPLERVELDHTRVDLIVVDDQDNLPLGRPTLTYCLDITTRYPLGYYLGFEPPSYLAVMECLGHAIRPKPSVREAWGTEHEWQAYGLPANLVVDNGKEFTGQSLQDACDVLGIRLTHSVSIAQPQAQSLVDCKNDHFVAGWIGVPLAREVHHEPTVDCNQRRLVPHPACHVDRVGPLCADYRPA